MDGMWINRADRRQPAFELVDLETLVPDDHRVRSIWSLVEVPSCRRSGSTVPRMSTSVSLGGGS